MTFVPRRMRRLASAVAVVTLAPTMQAAAQYVPVPQPAQRPLDNSPRTMSGVTVREGASYRPARTDLGASASPTYARPTIWSGFYAGMQGGVSNATVRANDPALGDIDSRNWFGGAHIGYLAQRGTLVFGLEGDVDLNRAAGDRSFASGFDASTRRNWTTSVRGRLGVALGNALVYGTLGAAISEMKLSATDGVSQSSGSAILPGVVFGGGIEVKMTDTISLRGEVLHYRFGTRNIELGGTNVPTRLDDTVVRAGVSFHFN